jgi:tungstate transport system permease protein
MLESLTRMVFLTLTVSGVALSVATVIGLPLGALLALRRVPGKRLIELLIYTGLGLPPVVVGLAVYLLLSRSGPLGGCSRRRPWSWRRSSSPCRS